MRTMQRSTGWIDSDVGRSFSTVFEGSIWITSKVTDGSERSDFASAGRLECATAAGAGLNCIQRLLQRNCGEITCSFNSFYSVINVRISRSLSSFYSDTTNVGRGYSLSGFYSISALAIDFPVLGKGTTLSKAMRRKFSGRS
jgi:hypothetical protein